MSWSPYDGAQLPARLAFGQSEYDWLAVELRGARRFAVLAWISRTGPRAARARTVACDSSLPSDLARIASYLASPSMTADDRPLFLLAAYDLECPERGVHTIEREIDHQDFDARTFSATTSDRMLELRQFEKAGAFHAHLRAKLDGFDLDVELRSEKSMLTFGNAGSPRIAQGPIVTAWGHRPRLAARARLGMDGRPPIELTGEACQDRQWLSVRPLLVKWLWLQLRWADGRELVGYVVREARRATESFEEGRILAREAWLIDAAGRKRPLQRFDLRSVPERDRTWDGRARCPTQFVLEHDNERLVLRHAVPTPYLPLKAFGAMLDGGMWTGPADGDFDGYAWVDVMTTALTSWCPNR